jgi:hypothetical protein
MKTETTAVDNEPHGFEDLPWRIGYRVKRGLFHVFGPPTLNDRNNPHMMLERERAARYADRRPAVTESAV